MVIPLLSTTIILLDNSSLYLMFDVVFIVLFREQLILFNSMTIMVALYKVHFAEVPWEKHGIEAALRHILRQSLWPYQNNWQIEDMPWPFCQPRNENYHITKKELSVALLELYLLLPIDKNINRHVFKWFKVGIIA